MIQIVTVMFSRKEFRNPTLTNPALKTNLMYVLTKRNSQFMVKNQFYLR